MPVSKFVVIYGRTRLYPAVSVAGCNFRSGSLRGKYSASIEIARVLTKHMRHLFCNLNNAREKINAKISRLSPQLLIVCYFNRTNYKADIISVTFLHEPLIVHLNIGGGIAKNKYFPNRTER